MWCSEFRKLPTVEFLFGQYWMELRPEDYMMYTDSDCFICIAEDPSIDQMILGSGFLRGFYSTHDLSTNRFGFAAHATSTKADPRYGTQPD